MDTQKVTDAAPSGARRSFLGMIAGGIVASITGVLGVVMGRFAIAPAFSAASEPEWIDLGTLAEIPEGGPVKRRIVIPQTYGWERSESPRAVWVVRHGQRIKIFSAACPHLGCAVGARGSGFGCACHGSSWNTEGAKLGGPTPRDLDELEYRLEGPALKIKYQDFKQGLASKEVIS
jgi:menaquinol-cytochrome c reductase iron-sulfur subunit